MNDSSTGAPLATKLEQRAWTLLIGLCLALGGWWLQNQYTTLMSVKDDLAEHQREATRTFLSRELSAELHRTLDRRIEKLEEQVRALEAERHTSP